MKLIPKILLGLGLMALPAFCGPIGIGSGWYVFIWGPGLGPTGTAMDAFAAGGTSGYTGTLNTPIAGISCTPSNTAPCDSFSQPFSFSGAATLVVNDLFFDGDRFQIYDNGVLIGTTSVPGTTQPSCGNDPAGCTQSYMSKGSFVISNTGLNSISINLIEETPGINNGQAVLELLAGPAVPEPTTLSMMGLGLGALLFGWRARRKA